jgi:anti-sigma-K factor RskA
MTEALTPREEDIALAGEYVLGVQDAPARAAVEARMRRDAGFAALVAQWERDFSAMDGGFAEAPAPDLLPQIEARLFGRPAARQPRRWWRFALGAGVAAALAVLVLAVLPPPPPPGPLRSATLAAEGQPLVFAARWDGRDITVRREAGAAAAAGQVHELWLIAGEGAAPVSLGLLDGAELRRPLDALPAGAVLAVSLEPAGGSPTGAPTGPVLVTGVVEG